MPINPRVALRPATKADIPALERWDREPHVIRATSDDAKAEQAFDGAYWPDELALTSPAYQYFLAELDGRPIGAMLMIDPREEPTHYWGHIEPNLRALDIWIGEGDALGKGYGEAMMRLAFQRCFADAAVRAVVIDPLASNTRAHAFYRRIGFVPEERRQFADSDCLVHRLTREAWRARFPEDVS